MAKSVPITENSFFGIILKGINLTDLLLLTPKELEDWITKQKDIVIIEDEIKKQNLPRWN